MQLQPALDELGTKHTLKTDASVTLARGKNMNPVLTVCSVAVIVAVAVAVVVVANAADAVAANAAGAVAAAAEADQLSVDFAENTVCAVSEAVVVVLALQRVSGYCRTHL